MEWISEMAADGGRVAEPVKLFLSRAWDSNIQNRPVQPCRRKQIRKYSTSHLSSFSCPIGGEGPHMYFGRSIAISVLLPLSETQVDGRRKLTMKIWHQQRGPDNKGAQNCTIVLI